MAKKEIKISYSKYVAPFSKKPYNANNNMLLVLRVFATIMVIFLHLNAANGALYNGAFMENGVNLTASVFFEFISIAAVNIFIIMFAWFSFKRTTVAWKRIAGTISLVLFYSIVWGTVKLVTANDALILNTGEINWNQFKVFFMQWIDADGYWFIPCYIIFSLMVPAINKMLKKIKEKDMIDKFILCVIGVYIVWKIFENITKNINGFNPTGLFTGYNAVRKIGDFTLFAYIYFITYWIKERVATSKILRNRNLWGTLFLGGCGFMTILWMVFKTTGTKQINLMNTLMPYDNIYVLFLGFSIFLWFMNMKKCNWSTRKLAFIKGTANLSLGVYIGHFMPWGMFFNGQTTAKYYDWVISWGPFAQYFMMAIVLATVLFVFTLFAFVEKARQLSFDRALDYIWAKGQESAAKRKVVRDLRKEVMEG